MIVGHAEPIAAFIDAAASKRLHHAWLFAGKRGIGKALTARSAAEWLLARAAGGDVASDRFDVPAHHPTRALLAAGSHPDFKVLERAAKSGPEDLARSIVVDQVRTLQPWLATTPSLSPRRVVLIDAIDDLERSAANALLKNLEEPPMGTVFLLVSHAPGRLLPTIRSRCRLLRFGPMRQEEVTEVLKQVGPDLSMDERSGLAQIANGSPGEAMRFAGLDLSGLDTAIDTLARRGDASNALRTTLARTLSSKSAQPRYEAFLERAPARIAAAARLGPGEMGRVLTLWRRARDIADRALRQSLDPQLTVAEIAGLVAALAPGESAAKG